MSLLFAFSLTSHRDPLVIGIVAGAALALLIVAEEIVRRRRQ